MGDTSSWNPAINRSNAEYTGFIRAKGAAKTALRGKTYLKNAALLTVADFALRALLGSVPGLGVQYDVLLCPLVTAWYLLTELGSVIENAGALGAPLPQFLVRAIAVLRADVSQRGGGDGDT